MVEVRLGDQVACHDPDATAAAYASLACGYADRCGCDPCRNFAAQRSTIYPPNFLALLHRLGIDPLKEGEAVYHAEVSPGVHLYGGWFYFIGRLLAAGEYRVEENGFSYFIGTSFPKPPRSFGGQPVVALEFETRLPWVLAAPAGERR